MHTHYVFHVTHLHVSVPLDHLQGAFCYRIRYCLNAQVHYTSIYSARAELCCVLRMLKFTLVKMSDTHTDTQGTPDILTFLTHNIYSALALYILVYCTCTLRH